MNKEVHPLVSIVIPVYNGSNYMREAIDSALAQTYSNIEILVINDGSTDDGATHDIAKSYGEKIRYFKKENGGVVSALNFGIDNMKGEYFSWLSHDDLYMPEKIEKQVKALKNHKGTRPAFCISNCIFINENGEEMYKTYVNRDCAFDHPRCFLLLGNVGFNGIMVLIPKILFEICGKFTPSLATHEYEMWLRIMDVADVVVESEYLSCMRLHSAQVTNQRKLDVNKESDRFIGKSIKEIPHSDFQAFMLDQINTKGVKYITDLLNSYMLLQHFTYTSIQTLYQLRLAFDTSKTEIDSIYSFLLGHTEIEEIKGYFKKRINNDTPLIIIYLEYVTDVTITGILNGIALLSAQYEIVLLYQTIEENNLELLRDIDILPIKLMNHLDENMSMRLFLLSYLFNAKLFWYYTTENNIRYSKIFNYLDIAEICSIASLDDIDKMYLCESDIKNKNYVDLKKNLSMASLITSRTALSESRFPSVDNFIVIINDDLKALVRWKMIFKVLLTTNKFSEINYRISNDLSHIIEKNRVSFESYVSNYIRDFLVEVDIKAATLISSYEARRFWKLTKPLRICVWAFRKAIRIMKQIFKEKKNISINYLPFTVEI